METAKVGFITEVDIETPEEAIVVEEPEPLENTPSTPSRMGTRASLPAVTVYNVEFAELPAECYGGLRTPCQLPASIPMDKIMTNIVQNLDFKGWSEQARSLWFKDFKSPCSRAVIQDTFWFCICWYFKPGKHPDVETHLFDRISAHFVGLFGSLSPSRKDFFFRCYADAVAQAVLYAMFLAYPKSRIDFTDKFRKDLVIRISFWTSGICPEFVDTSHWKLNLGGGDVLQAAPNASRSVEVGRANSSPLLGQLSADSMSEKQAWVGQWNRRPRRKLQYSPLVENFLRARKYSSVNLVQATSMHMTTAEQRAKKMDVKHAMLAERATAARERCDKLCLEYADLEAEVKKQERQRQTQAQAAKKRLEIRRKEVLRSDPHEYANYLVSLHLLQQGLGQKGCAMPSQGFEQFLAQDGVDFLSKWLVHYAEQEEVWIVLRVSAGRLQMDFFLGVRLNNSAKSAKAEVEKELAQLRVQTREKAAEAEKKRQQKEAEVQQLETMYSALLEKFNSEDTTFEDKLWQELVACAKATAGASSVYLGVLEQGEEGGEIPGQYISYEYASQGSDWMTEKVLTEGKGVTWGALTENPAAESFKEMCLWKPPSVEPVPVETEEGAEGARASQLSERTADKTAAVALPPVLTRAEPRPLRTNKNPSRSADPMFDWDDVPEQLGGPNQAALDLEAEARSFFGAAFGGEFGDEFC
ncbi:unnamed protein product [Effrenium voratum]|nr:unnamed protein product [Effrenium voratum]